MLKHVKTVERKIFQRFFSCCYRRAYAKIKMIASTAAKALY
ncbi:hypothetical protein AB434_3786 [Heyndrickxia coagulans]|uniref:Uncharacterized protein n=1 Tax=Heyndrickxia coagulans TaxID=1398 RepID=A0AAN0WBN9_HEYCO|nr:hypothetical protein SB48_HM08orf02336 [Heyndrickxia coagulans]AKN56191.1 hypothetical protein AB434_3786 [Heyndrickxia coagulans]